MTPTAEKKPAGLPRLRRKTADEIEEELVNLEAIKKLDSLTPEMGAAIGTSIQVLKWARGRSMQSPTVMALIPSTSKIRELTK